jgi:hypothetical protein
VLLFLWKGRLILSCASSSRIDCWRYICEGLCQSCVVLSFLRIALLSRIDCWRYIPEGHFVKAVLLFKKIDCWRYIPEGRCHTIHSRS